MPRVYNKLTAQKVARLVKPGRYSDGGNLYVQVSGNRGKSWLFRVETQLIRRWMGLGSVHTVSLEEARDMARAARLCVLKGIDPVEQHRQDRLRRHLEQVECPDFDSCAAAYIARHAVAWKNAKHRQQWENTLRTYASPIIGPVKVRYIDTSMILQVLQPIWTLRPETANRLRGRLERILAWAKVLGYRQGENPARWRGHLQELLPRREALQAVRHHPALPHEHMAGFWAVLLGHTGK